MAGPGRPKGSINKVSALVKENVLHVFDQMGGVRKMTEWAAANPTEFYRLYARLLPTEATLNVQHVSAAELSDSELASIASRSGDRAASETEREEVPSSVH